jgi:hypothetical protein
VDRAIYDESYHYMANHDIESDGIIIGKCTNTDTDDDEDLVSAKITQKLTMTGKVLCECD